MSKTVGNDVLLAAVADHLRLPLLQIARLSELETDAVLPRIQLISTQALKLVDAHNLAQNQLELNLEPVSAGAILADVTHSLRPLAKDAGYSVSVDQQSPTEPIMAHKETLHTMMTLLGTSMIDSGLEQELVDRRIVFGVRKTGRGIIVGAFHGSLEINQDVIKLARRLQGRASQPAPALGAAGAASLAIADMLSNNLQTPLKSYRYQSMKGLGSLFQPTAQLQLL